LIVAQEYIAGSRAKTSHFSPKAAVVPVSLRSEAEGIKKGFAENR
jgi:hypothetical protein